MKVEAEVVEQVVIVMAMTMMTTVVAAAIATIESEVMAMKAIAMAAVRK